MKNGQCSWCVALIAGAAGFGAAVMLGAGEPEKKATPAQAPAHAQPGGHEMTPEQQREMEAWMAACTPGEMHKKLEYFAGKWTCEVKSYHGPTEVTTGTMTGEMMHDGRFVMSHFKGTMMDHPFEGTSVMGYNNASKKFENVWFDSMNTAMGFSTGAMDAAGKKMSLSGETMCPVDNVMKRCRSVTTIVDADNYTMEFFQAGKDGKEELGMEIAFKRAK